MSKVVFMVFVLMMSLTAHTTKNFFNSQNYRVNNYGTFKLSEDKKSFYSFDNFSRYKIKQIDINS